MSWLLRRITWKTPFSEQQPGDWWERAIDEPNFAGYWADSLSPEFRNSGRTSAIYIHIPGDCGIWSPDIKANANEHGWTLTLAADGSPLTAMPSINAEGCYHGWLTNGVLTDDCEGRTFERTGGTV